MSLYMNAVAAERAAKIERDRMDHEAGIESLRQQLYAEKLRCDEYMEDNKRLARELADMDAHYQASLEAEQVRFHQYVAAQADNVRLREALDRILWDEDQDTLRDTAKEALAATADLEGLVLCDRIPVCMADPLDIAKDGNNDTFIVKHASEWHELLRFKIPLYRKAEL